MRAFEFASGTPPRRAGPPELRPRLPKPFSSEVAEVKPPTAAPPVPLTLASVLVAPAPERLAWAAPIMGEGPACGAFALVVALPLAWDGSCPLFELLFPGLSNDGF